MTDGPEMKTCHGCQRYTACQMHRYTWVCKRCWRRREAIADDLNARIRGR